MEVSSLLLTDTGLGQLRPYGSQALRMESSGVIRFMQSPLHSSLIPLYKCNIIKQLIVFYSFPEQYLQH